MPTNEPVRDAAIEAAGEEPRARHRLNSLLGAKVLVRGGHEAGHVNDVRLAGGPGLQNYLVEGLVVGRRTQGSMLGYDRREVRGPWLVRALVAAANKDAGYVPWRAVRRIDWDAGSVEVDRVDPLTEERPGS
jgi:sporulation protein YlmC with PRC-barrel domain